MKSNPPASVILNWTTCRLCSIGWKHLDSHCVENIRHNARRLQWQKLPDALCRWCDCLYHKTVAQYKTKIHHLHIAALQISSLHAIYCTHARPEYQQLLSTDTFFNTTLYWNLYWCFVIGNSGFAYSLFSTCPCYSVQPLVDIIQHHVSLHSPHPATHTHTLPTALSASQPAPQC